MRSVLASPPSAANANHTVSNRLLVAGIAAFVLAFGGWLAYLAIHAENWTLNMIDLTVYLDGGKIVRHVPGFYNGHDATPLYDWSKSKHGLQFTYTPFAAVAFALFSVVSAGTATAAWTVVNFLALLAAIWLAAGALGYRQNKTRAGITLLGAGVAIWLEPVFRNIFLGQINLVLMAFILWDLLQPDHRKNKGFITGIAAGVKLVPLIFIPYLIVTRKFRQAAMVIAGFVFTLAAGFAVLPKDSAKYWFDGLFANGGRTGFTGWEGNQSLDGIITRLSGSISSAKPLWMAAVVIVGVAGILAAMLLYRAGHQLPALLLVALTGDLISPISWDHHWVWIAVDIVVVAHYAVQFARAGRKRAAWLLGAAAVAIVAVFAAWPGALWGERMNDKNTFFLGIIWNPPNSNPFTTYYLYGDKPWLAEYHWHGFQLLTGNAYILAAIAAFACLVVAAVRLPRAREEVVALLRFARPQRQAG